MSTTAAQVFGGSRVQSSAVNVELTAADKKLHVITMTTASKRVELPVVKAFGEALKLKISRSWVIINPGANSYDVTDSDGNAIDGGVTLAQNEAVKAYLIGNSTGAGEWITIKYTIGSGGVTREAVGYFFQSDNDSDSTWQFNQLTDEWTQMADIAGLSDGARKNLYGNFGESDLYLLDDGTGFHRKYDASADSWSGSNLTTPGIANDFAALVGDTDTGSFLWGVGGDSAASDRFLYKYDITGDSWGSAGPLSADVAAGTLVFGWYEPAPDFASSYLFVSPSSSTRSGEAYSFDHTAEDVTELTPCPRLGTYGYGGFLVRDSERYFDVGGASGFGSPRPMSGEVWEYDTSGDDWLPKANVPFTERRNFPAYGGDFNGFVHGGEDENDDRLDDTWKYDLSADDWTEVAAHGGGTDGTSTQAAAAAPLNF